MRLIMLACIMAGLPVIAHAQILKKEPAMGKLKPGQTVLVDDGVCPKGQVRQVTGGNHVKVGGTMHVERTRQCVPR